MIDDSNVLPLFAVPLCKTKIEEPSAEIQDYLKNKIKFVKNHYSDADNSEELHVLNDPICKPLKDALVGKMYEYLDYLDVDQMSQFNSSKFSSDESRNKAVAQRVYQKQVDEFNRKKEELDRRAAAAVRQRRLPGWLQMQH